MVTSPMMRFLAVADVARSTAFYQDVLGFEVKGEAGGTEAILGPARIRFEEAGHAPGSAILFLQTDDVAAQRAAILARGGTPSEIEKVK